MIVLVYIGIGLFVVLVCAFLWAIHYINHGDYLK